jgi:predicted RNase H-like nuclease (RuvC/YqgF family)
LQQFEEIEQKVDRLIRANQTLEDVNKELKAENLKLTQELRDKIEAEKRYTEVRSLIRSKIDGLMSRLDGIAELEEA